MHIGLMYEFLSERGIIRRGVGGLSAQLLETVP